jgi:hypothetical protein
MRKYVIVGLSLAAFATPALAQEFYVVQDTATKRCTIVDKKPTVATQIIVNEGGTIYKSRTDADAALKKIKVCEELKK